METALAEKTHTVKEYLAFEEKAKNKHEFYNGKIVKMPGASYVHNKIATNILVALGIALNENKFVLLNSDMKVHIPHLQTFVYPDVVVICEKAELYPGRKDVLLNPLLIVEVLSKATKNYDRSVKFQHYKTLPSFKEYVLIEQSQPWVVASYKAADRTWVDTEAFNINESVYLKSVDCSISLERIYKGVEFTGLAQ